MSLTSHSILLITERAASGTPLQAALNQIGIREVFMAHSYRDALEIGLKECPHLIVFESDLQDGGAIGLLKKFRAETFFDKTPIVIIRKPTREELLEIVKLKVAAVLAKPLEIQGFIEKVKSIFDTMGDGSPYGIKGTEIPGGQSTSIRFQATVVGRDDKHLICQSTLTLAEGGNFLISPSDAALPPIIAVSAGSMKTGNDKESNLFGLTNLLGKGRTWVMQMPPIKPAVPMARRVLFYENSKERLEQLREILSFHEVEIEAVDSLQRLAQTFMRSPDDYKVIYLCETPIGSAAIPWDKAIQGIPEPKRPIQVISTSAMQSKSRSDVIWLRKPFTVDQMVETFEVAFAQRAPGAAPGNMDKTMKEIPCSYIVKGQILTVDESGGLLELEAPATANAQVFIDHVKFKSNDKTHQVRIVQCINSPTNPKMWQARFSTVAPGSSKGNSWRQLKPIFVPEGAAGPAAATAT